jgi:hypothetical protein
MRAVAIAQALTTTRTRRPVETLDLLRESIFKSPGLAIATLSFSTGHQIEEWFRVEGFGG